SVCRGGSAMTFSTLKMVAARSGVPCRNDMTTAIPPRIRPRNRLFIAFPPRIDLTSQGSTLHARFLPDARRGVARGGTGIGRLTLIWGDRISQRLRVRDLLCGPRRHEPLAHHAVTYPCPGCEVMQQARETELAWDECNERGGSLAGTPSSKERWKLGR